MEPDLLLVDLTRLPEKGKEMVASLADDGKLKEVPVVLVSENSNASRGLKGKVKRLHVTSPTKIISGVKSALNSD